MNAHVHLTGFSPIGVVNWPWPTDHSGSGYDGCHGNGCLVDNPDAIDTRPQFDKDGNPNFDTHGNYQGCHGEGCKVDDPDANN